MIGRFLVSSIGIVLSISVALINTVHSEAPEIQGLRKSSRSRMGITRKAHIAEVFLFAEDEKVEILEHPYCGGDKGDKQYTGNYQLISVLNNEVVASIISLGHYQFVVGRIYDGIREVAVPGTNERLIAIYQYRGCNGDEVEFYRVDKNGGLNKVVFLNKDGTKEDNQYTSDQILLSDNEATFCGYNNAVGYVFCDSYRYNGENFIQVASWMTQELYRSPKTIDGEARRALFDFLISLYHGKYEAAAYYYRGSHDVLKDSNPDVNPNNRAKLFERYCTANGGLCLIPEGMVFKQTDLSDESKFAVSFVTRDFKSVQLAGKSQFEFRVKRVDSDFKVLDLPPYVPLTK